MNQIALSVSHEDGPTLRARFDLGRPRIPVWFDEDGQTTETEIHYSELKPLIDRLLALRIPPWPQANFGGLASLYSIQFEIGGAKASYRWTLRPPDGWEPLQEILGGLVALIRRRSEPGPPQELDRSNQVPEWWKLS
jgi:hypothetical protein